MVGATRRVARYRAARRAAPTFRNDEVAAQRRRLTFYETIRIYSLTFPISPPIIEFIWENFMLSNSGPAEPS